MNRTTKFAKKLVTAIAGMLLLTMLFANSAFAIYGNISSPYVDITDITGELPSYSPGALIDVEIKVVNLPNGTPAAPSQGWAVQYYTYDASNPASYIQSYVTNSQYNAGSLNTLGKIFQGFGLRDAA